MTATSNEQTCPVCNVTIVPAPGGDRVLFSTGAPGTRARLWARVCQFVQRPGCINQNQEAIGAVSPDDAYKPDAPQS
ncbi:MAG: hypothetical protein AAFY15_01215 [Cyanobacteria bacterium J06648_11]